MLQPWRADDFIAAVRQPLRPADFWDAQIVEARWTSAEPSCFLPPAHSSDPALSPQRAAPSADFWDPLPLSDIEEIKVACTWSDDISLPGFERQARENPYHFQEVLPSHESIARRRARWLASLLDVPTLAGRRRFADKFEHLFDEFTHANTFRILSELAIEGTLGDEILTGFELKLVWIEQPVFWSIRRKGHHGPLVPDNGAKLLGWTRAIRLACLAKGLPAERIIDHDWYDEWLRLPYGDPLSWSFLEYATARLESFSRGVLVVPNMMARYGDDRPYDSIRSITIDGLQIGSFSRTGTFVRSSALGPSKAIEVQQSDKAA